jgi:hypothetical protein
MKINTHCSGAVRSHRTNATNLTYPARIPTIVDPLGANDGVVKVGGTDNGDAMNAVRIVPICANCADDDTFTIRVLGWFKTVKPGVKDIWTPLILCEVACKVVAVTGVAGSAVLDTEFYCDTIGDPTIGNKNVDVKVVSPADNASIAYLEVDTVGCEYIEIIVDHGTDTGSNNAANFLVAQL